jgi:hypothetical protein
MTQLWPTFTLWQNVTSRVAEIVIHMQNSSCPRILIAESGQYLASIATLPRCCHIQLPFQFIRSSSIQITDLIVLLEPWSTYWYPADTTSRIPREDARQGQGYCNDTAEASKKGQPASYFCWEPQLLKEVDESEILRNASERLYPTFLIAR